MTESKKARALLVQLVERRSPKPDVGGSSPPGRALKKNKARNQYKTAKYEQVWKSSGYNCVCSFLAFRQWKVIGNTSIKKLYKQSGR